ncbi:hypothetical protein [Paraburkholderia rhizosphaerae]|uniref:hypothetical protein n=1 Tax=Paraburkholderia rhizosphaerae TaxID=480658 RepID=UPI001066395D|nr:hypothetical protein [Paraburkholderia rhizosphaerae]
MATVRLVSVAEGTVDDAGGTFEIVPAATCVPLPPSPVAARSSAAVFTDSSTVWSLFPDEWSPCGDMM